MRYRVRIPCITLSVRGMVTLIHSKPLEPFVSWKSPAGNQSVVCTSVRACVCVCGAIVPSFVRANGRQSTSDKPVEKGSPLPISLFG